jgi:hypothetical protein
VFPWSSLKLEVAELLHAGRNAASARIVLHARHVKSINQLNKLQLYTSPLRRPSAMADKLSEADIILNRTNVALARSQRLIQSWLPPKPAETAQDQVQDDEEDFAGEDELAGVGSKRKAEDEGLPDGAFRRKKLASNDKLLEQILGRKAAQARKKSQEASKGRAGSLHAAPKAMNANVPARKAEVESDEEEEGRAAAFRSKKQKKAHRREEGPALDEKQPDAEPGAPQGGAEEREKTTPAAQDSEPEEERPRKKAASSYLDEILGQKAKKKKNKQKNSGANPP